MKKIEVYTSPSCHFCNDLKEFLKGNNLEFVEHDVQSDEKVRQELVERSGQLGVPVVFIDDTEMVVGFNKEKISELLGL